jgi:hypothetical protein
MIENIMERIFADVTPIPFVQVQDNTQIVQVFRELFQRFIEIIGNLFRSTTLDTGIELTWHQEIYFLYNFF